jgi:uncharacterized protein YdaU (DUF1376 family)
LRPNPHRFDPVRPHGPRANWRDAEHGALLSAQAFGRLQKERTGRTHRRNCSDYLWPLAAGLEGALKHYPHHIGDFDRATRHLTRIERSVYRDLIELYYDTEQTLTLDREKLCRRIIARSNDESTAVEQVLNEFFTETPTGWYHARCEEELDAYRANTSQKALAGKASAEAKRLKKLQALNGNSTHVEQPLPTVATELNGASTNHQPSTINHQPIDMAASPPAPVKPAEPKKQKPVNRAIALPDDFYPNEAGVTYAEKLNVSMAIELQSFSNWHRAKGSTMKDWQAAWRTWCDKAVSFGRTGGASKATSFAQADELARRKRWEEMTGRKWPTEGDLQIVNQVPTVIDVSEIKEIGHELATQSH